MTDQRVGIYIRLSLADGDGKAESDSIGNQRELIHQFLDRHPPDRGVEPEAIGSEAAYVFALLHHDDLRRGGLDGQVLAVRLIDDVPQDHIHAGGHALVI